MRYRKKPVEIEARRVPADTSNITAYLDEGIALAEWCGGTSYLMAQDDEDDERAFDGCEFVGPHISIKTLGGDPPPAWIPGTGEGCRSLCVRVFSSQGCPA